MIKNKNNLIQRKMLNQVIDHLDEKEMTIIIGPRQVGKTTLLEQIQEYLKNKKQVKQDSIFYFNLDLTKNLELFSQQENLINFINNRKQKEKLMYLFIDEVQRIENAGLFLKGIYDANLGVKFIVTGSSSLEIKSKIQEALTGRKKIFNLMPLNFFEYISHTNSALLKIVQKQKIISDYDFYGWMKLISDFAIFGGYPAVIIEKDINKKISLLEELHNSYLEKDIINFLRIKNSVSFNRLVSLLAAQTGGLLNINYLSENIGAETKTVNHYLEVLENTFIIKLIRPFFTNAKKELIKMPKIYFIDNGIMNFALSRFSDLESRTDKGTVFENLIASELLKTIKAPLILHYWRSLQKAEVDFVIRKGDGEVIPIEVKAKKMNKINISKSYRSFLQKYNPDSAFLVNYNLTQKQKINKTNISALTILGLNDRFEI